MPELKCEMCCMDGRSGSEDLSSHDEVMTPTGVSRVFRREIQGIEKSGKTSQ